MTSSNNRIAFFFSTSGHSGVDTFVKNLIPALARRGYQLDLLKVRNHGPYLDHIPENVNVIDLGSKHTSLCLFPVIRYLKKFRPAVIYSDKDKVNRIALLACLISGVSTRAYVGQGTHVSNMLAHRKFLDRWMQFFSMKYLYRMAEKVIVTSKGVAQDLSENIGVRQNQIEIVPIPIISEELLYSSLTPPEHPWFKQGKPPVILGVGELGIMKDYATLVKAFSIVRSAMNCRLMILGAGKQRYALEKLARELDIADDFLLPGFVENPFPYMTHAGVFAHPSRLEGLGNVIVEALAVGTPVVATDCPSGPAEILQNGKYGKLVSIGNTEQLAHAIIDTLKAPLPKEFLREAARPYEIEASTTAYLKAMALPINV